jgi:hypothetical protein
MDATFDFPVLPTLTEFKSEMAEAKDDKAKKAVLAKYAAIGQAFKDAYPEGCFFRATVEDLSVSTDPAKAKVCHLILSKMPADLRNLLGGVALRHSSSMVSRMCGHVSVQTLASYASLYDGLGTVKVQVEFVNAGDKYSNGEETGVYEKPNFLITPVKIFMSDRVLAKIETIVEKRAITENQNPASAQVRRTAGDIEA